VDTITPEKNRTAEIPGSSKFRTTEIPQQSHPRTARIPGSSKFRTTEIPHQPHPPDGRKLQTAENPNSRKSNGSFPFTRESTKKRPGPALGPGRFACAEN